MTSPILVTGGTGTLGRHVVTQLRAAGRDVRVLSRHRHASGDGWEDFLAERVSSPESRRPSLA